MSYKFHRDFYYLVADSVKNNSTTFLLGTRKSGKTICLKQINNDFDNSQYIDFKQCDQKEKTMLLNQILCDIRANKSVIYLLDEITSVDYYNIEICKIAEAYTDLKNVNTKIVFSGSQSIALGICANIAFAGNTSVINVDFLTYSEFLRYKNINEISENSYHRFLMESFDFYDDFVSLRQYLEGCINETILSNLKSSEILYKDDIYLIEDNVDFLINVCYQTLFNLHNHVKAKRFFEDNKLKNDITYYFKNICDEIDDKTIAKKISDSFIGSYNVIKSQDVETLRQALLFLKRCGLIDITPVTNSIVDVPNIERNIRTGDRIIRLKDELFDNFNISIKYPMFYVQILKDILGNDMPQSLPTQLLGSIIECNARGLAPKGFELKVNEVNEDGIEIQKEIDLIDLKNSTAIELTIQKNHKNHFEIVPDYFKKIMLTKNVNSEQDGIIRIPYFEYIYNLSNNKYLVNEVETVRDEQPLEMNESSVSLEVSEMITSISQRLKETKAKIPCLINDEKNKVLDSFKEKERNKDYSDDLSR